MSADPYGLDKARRNENARREEQTTEQQKEEARRLNPPAPYRRVSFDPEYFGVTRWEPPPLSS
jgi:hypothetical protein